ncbi:transcriptional activator xlnR [Sugiyamaella lignohabitans]|uniref:Transcriptional activator xlnR n=1 Tax=Sugiyamaella lignohabitans TaxID=796027 RepID=A0A167EGD2_9ASCO|nr:transcriptional activator xlnR [Sugiyamaella lignohabitans]ANB14049.1 transcriptional activator xlnR [Sugiyamaella lignohabitans]
MVSPDLTYPSQNSKRARISRACDQCRASRTKCDGVQPCKRCSALSKSCEYFLQRKKRGRGSELYSFKRNNHDNSGKNLPLPVTDSVEGYSFDGYNGKPMNNVDQTSKISQVPFAGEVVPVESVNPHLMSAASSSLPVTDLDLSGLTEPDQDSTDKHPSTYLFDFLPTMTSPRWLNMSTLFPTELFATSHSLRNFSDTTIQYPVLLPILPDLDFIQPELINDLIEVYFSNSVYGIAPIIRKSSLLSHHNPRKCTPALLFSFLLVSAHATDHPLIKSTASTREQITSRLSDLVISHMKALHSGGTLDDVITYIHLGILASMSEFKGAAMRWWHAAWGLARLLKFNQECPALDEEKREEQRRTWWLLFLTDRHLSLCYNQMPSTLDSESCDLYLPVNEKRWSSDEPLVPAESDTSRQKGPVFKVYDSGLFGMYLPLMTLLGGILDLHFLQMNQTLAVNDDVLEMLRTRFSARLNDFETSIEVFSSQIPDNGVGAYVKAWKEYCHCLVHIFHILVQGYLDPIDLLNSIDDLIGTPVFKKCVDHAIAAAKSIDSVLIFDPDLRLIPYFFGIQLLQAGFVLLCLADKLGTETSKEVRDACETLVHGHEVCIVTLNTEYQRNFRSILRSAIRPTVLPGMDGVTTELDEARHRRREVLGLYRWCSGGTGLAI